MPKAEKVERVGQLKARIQGSDALLLTEYRGLTVSDITELRRALAEGGTSFAVVKNTLMQRAATEASIDELESLLEGPTAVAFISGDPVTAAKKVVEAAKKFPALILKGGYMEGRVLSAEEAKSLADLDSREVMLSKVAGMLKSEMSRAAAMFVSAQSKFLGLLEAYKEKVPDDSVVAEVPASPQAEEPQAEEPEVEEPQVEERGDVAESIETGEVVEDTETQESVESIDDTSEAAASDEEGEA